MVEQFLTAENFILQVEILEVYALYPDDAQVRELESIVVKLHDYESVTLAL